MKTVAVPFLYPLLSFILLFTSACNQPGRNNREQVPATGDTMELKSQNAMELHDKLMRSFGEDWMERESDPDLYPTYYGGSFIDNNGAFVVAVTGDREANTRRLTEILGTDNFKVETVQYSYRQMMLVMDRVDAFLVNPSITEDHPVMARFAGAYPDVMDNRVKVILTAVNDEAIRAFKRDVSDSPMVVFEQGEMPELF